MSWHFLGGVIDSAVGLREGSALRMSGLVLLLFREALLVVDHGLVSILCYCRRRFNE